MDPRNLPLLFYLIAAAPWLFLGFGTEPVFVIALGSISVMSLMVPIFIREGRRKAELGISPGPWALSIEDPVTKDLRRIIGNELMRAVGSAELAGRRLRHELEASPTLGLNPESLRELTAWLDSARRDLAQARSKLNELTPGAS